MIFFSIFLLIFVVTLFLLTSFQSPFVTQIKPISPFQITKISGSGSIYTNPAMSETVDIKAVENPGEAYYRADAQTSFECYYANTFFTLLPGSSLYFQSKTKEIYLNGEFFWRKAVSGHDLEIYLASDQAIANLHTPQHRSIAEESHPMPRTILTLGDFGRIKMNQEETYIWNYAGNSKLNYQSESHPLNPNQMLKLVGDEVTILDLLHAPEYISPENKTIFLDKQGDSIVKFSWKNVAGASQYILRLFTSSLKENILWEKTLASNRKSIDIIGFEDVDEIYWQVYPLDAENNLEGSPSNMGKIQIVGILFDREKLLEPPNLVINSLTVSGNMVLIKGEADANSQLFINTDTVKIDMDGKFIHTITFKTIGKKNIVFRLVSPSEIETVAERQVSIFEE
jgi:hypothetical protein